MRIEDPLRAAVLRSEPGTHQRQQAEELLAHLNIAKKYGFNDRDFGDLDRREAEFKGLEFDKETKQILLEKRFLIFPIRPIPYRVMDFETREKIEIVPEEREVAVMGKSHFIAKTRSMSSFEEHVAAIEVFKKILRKDVWTVDVTIADIATYHQLEGQFNEHFNYHRGFFEIRDKERTGFGTLTSSRFGDKIVILGKNGAYSPTISGLIDPKLDLTAIDSHHADRRVFIAIPVVVPAKYPLFL